MNDMKLYVWQDVLYEYEAGIMFALASSVEEARELLANKCPRIPAADLAKEPLVVTEPAAFRLWGGS